MLELLASLFNPTQLGQIRDVTKSVSLEDVAEIATSSFRSMGTTREDSLVFVLGLLNLGTVLCYAIYSQIFKPIRRGSSTTMDENHFVMKKIQTILDELVLHVHTTTYYRSSLERTQGLAKEFNSKRETDFRPRSSDSSSIRSLFTIFDFPESAVYGEKEPPSIEQFTSRRSSDDYDNYLQREAKKMIQEWLSFLVQSTTNPFDNSRTKRHTMMSLPNSFRRNVTGRRRPWSPSSAIRKRIGTTTATTTLSPSTWKPVNHRSLMSKSPSTTTTTTDEPQPEWTLNQMAMSQLRRPQMKRLVAAATGAEADGRVLAAAAQAAVVAARSTSSGPDVSHPTHQEDVPVLPVLSLFPHGTVRERGASHSGGQFKSGRATSSRSGLRIKNGSTEKVQEKSTTEPTTTTTMTTTTTTTTTTPKTQSEPRHIPSEFRQQMYHRNAMLESDSPYDLDDSASNIHSSEEDGLIVRFMRLIQQATPLAMDVLDVYKTRSSAGQHSPQSSEPKCLERLLCQLNQDWKGRGSVPAAMAPFLSIAMGWLMDRSTTPNLSHILMAVRAGWIGKQCASLYPRCSNPGRPQWTVAPLHDDSLNLPSIGQPPVKVRPPLDFFAFTPTPSSTHLDSTLRPISSSVRAIPSPKPNQKVPHSSDSTDLRTTTSSSTANKKTSSTPDWVRESVQSETNANGVWGQHSFELGEEEQTTSALIGTSLQVDRNGEAGTPVSSGSDNTKPWGKPSRFSGSDDIELSDIVRGVYSTTTEKDHHLDEEDDEEYDGEEEEEEEEEEEDNEENEEDPNPSTKKPAAHYQEDSILHDLNRNHFIDKAVSENPTKIKDNYEEIQKKKTHRLEMVPNRGLVHPWLSEPVWVPENAWPSKTDSNRLRSDEENEETVDRHRDRVSFGHEDAVKDVRLFDFAMQYLRDRSA